MVRKFVYGKPLETEAVLTAFEECEEELPFLLYEKHSEVSPDTDSFSLPTELGFSEKNPLFTYSMKPDDIIYGLGEAVRGINKRGWRYISFCADDPDHTESKFSLYGAHNFLMILGEVSFGLFFDFPGAVLFDIGASDYDRLFIRPSGNDLTVYVIERESPLEIVREFRNMTGRSYLPPRWAFGFQQSRWGYQSADDVRQIVQEYRNNHIPLDSVYLDIDYMTNYKDFTIDKHKFPAFPSFVTEMKKDHIRLVPIIDAGVKIEDGYDVYEEGIAGNYFCKRKDGSDFVAGVWPGITHFPDFLNKDARKWFGGLYARLLSKGIEGFWNDMNEPAIFYSEEGVKNAWDRLSAFDETSLDVEGFFQLTGIFTQLSSQPADYARFYHRVGRKNIRHDKVHNLYGYNMTRAASEAFDRYSPKKRILLFSRSSYIGMHRYGGIWTGDNHSWWSHLLLNIKMMPSLNMCGFLYSGADIGGFGSDTTQDLLLRWLAFGLFTPLMRNHSAIGTRNQECFRFGHIESFRNLINLRYRLLPFLYSEFMKAALTDSMYFRTLLFDYPQDSHAIHVEDQLLLGDSLMLAPVYEQNAVGRYVYLPEDMLLLRFLAPASSIPEGENSLSLQDGAVISTKYCTAGHHYLPVALDEVIVFLRKGHLLLLCAPAEAEELLNTEELDLVAVLDDAKQARGSFYVDDGFCKDPNLEENLVQIQLESAADGSVFVHAGNTCTYHEHVFSL